MYDPAIINLPEYTYSDAGKREINMWWKNLESEVKAWKKRIGSRELNDVNYYGGKDLSQLFMPPAHLSKDEVRPVVTCKWLD